MAGCSAHPDNWYCPKCDYQEETNAKRLKEKGFEEISEEDFEYNKQKYTGTDV